MEKKRILRLGIEVPPILKDYVNSPYGAEVFYNLFSDKANAHSKMMYLLAEYFILHKRKFDQPLYLMNFERDIINNSIPISGILHSINNTVVDIGVIPKALYKEVIEAADFSYPISISSETFVVTKARYKPQIFAIFQTLSLWVWLAILLIFIMMIILHYITSKSRYSFNYVVLHVFSVLVRQASIVTPSSLAEKILTHSWVIGAMFLCLAYDSVFLSFLAFPPLQKIKHLSQLSKLVEAGEYHCVGGSELGAYLRSENNRYLRIVGADMLKYSENSFIMDPHAWFLRHNKEENLAVFVSEGTTDIFTGDYYISEDRFLGALFALLVRKYFCCKNLLDEFVHRMMASGLRSEIYKLGLFLTGLPLRLEYSEEYTSKRPLTLTDVAPAFLFLIIGHFISILCLIGEILSRRKKNSNLFTKRRKRKIESENEISV